MFWSIKEEFGLVVTKLKSQRCQENAIRFKVKRGAGDERNGKFYGPIICHVVCSCFIPRHILWSFSAALTLVEINCSLSKTLCCVTKSFAFFTISDKCYQKENNLWWFSLKIPCNILLRVIFHSSMPATSFQIHSRPLAGCGVAS